MDKILVKGTNWIGDVFLSLPAVYSIRRIFPGAEIDIALKRPLGDLVRGVDVINNVLDYDGDFSGELDLVRRIRKKGYDLGVIFPRSLHSALLIFLGGVKERLGYAADMRSVFLTKRIPRTEEIRSVHQSEYYRNLVSTLGDPGPLVTPKLSPFEEEVSWARNFLRRHGYRGGPLFGINPGAAYGDAKMWYAERFAKVSDELVKKFGGNPVIFGGAKDLEAAKEVARSMESEPIFAAGRTTVRELIALISTCTVFITNDSGPMHMAAALGIPIVAVFGSTNPITTSPIGRAEIIRYEVDCSPCLLRTCPRDDHICMELVEASEVIDGAEKLILSGGSG